MAVETHGRCHHTKKSPYKKRINKETKLLKKDMKEVTFKPVLSSKTIKYAKKHLKESNLESLPIEERFIV